MSVPCFVLTTMIWMSWKFQELSDGLCPNCVGWLPGRTLSVLSKAEGAPGPQGLCALTHPPGRQSSVDSPSARLWHKRIAGRWGAGAAVQPQGPEDWDLLIWHALSRDNSWMESMALASQMSAASLSMTLCSFCPFPSVLILCVCWGVWIRREWDSKWFSEGSPFSVSHYQMVLNGRLNSVVALLWLYRVIPNLLNNFLLWFICVP